MFLFDTGYFDSPFALSFYFSGFKCIGIFQIIGISNNPPTPQKVFPYYTAMARLCEHRECMDAWCLLSFPPHLPSSPSLVTFFQAWGYLLNTGKFSLPLLLSSVLKVWNSTGLPHCPEESTHFSLKLSFDAFSGSFYRSLSQIYFFYFLLSWYFDSNSVKACITVFYFCLFISLFLTKL